MRFCTVINCMDGRVQLPVMEYLQRRFDALYVDSITEAGPNRILAEQQDAVESILERLKISVNKHHSVGIAVVGHHDCAGNPAPKEQQEVHIRRAVRFLKERFEGIQVIGLWVDENWKVQEIAPEDPGTR
ncbi:MAG: hypothetical protein D6681_09820 [Calditrichaeota bacterium]|nr:MAG: hypothetical protein D6681_09820 [Calditrichota bacterium]